MRKGCDKTGYGVLALSTRALPDDLLATCIVCGLSRACNKELRGSFPPFNRSAVIAEEKCLIEMALRNGSLNLVRPLAVDKSFSTVIETNVHHRNM